VVIVSRSWSGISRELLQTHLSRGSIFWLQDIKYGYFYSYSSKQMEIGEWFVFWSSVLRILKVLLSNIIMPL
jgi:hypothetical protein